MDRGAIHRPPQQLAAVLINSLQGSVRGDPALRTIGTTGRKIFGGGALMPQRFVRPPQPNDAAALQDVGQAINTRRALNRARGRI